MEPAGRIRAGVTLTALAVIAVACGGGGSPAAPTSRGVLLHGTLVGAGASAMAAGATASASAEITVTVVENPAITATVGADGSFTLRGLPEGRFTLAFSSGATSLGTLAFDGINPNQEITITVQVVGGTVVLMEQLRNGIGHGNIEIEGLAEQVLVLNPTGESRFRIDAHVVAARPGETAIREGNRARTVNDVTVGRRVHVKGVWLPMEGSVQPVLAQEIMLQGDATVPSPSPSPQACPVGGNAEVEGPITAKAAPVVTVSQQGKGDYLCTVTAATRIRKGNTTYTFDQLQIGWRVHVKGTMQGPSGSACQVSADEIMVQQN